jgi:hypothetical protein
MTGILGFLNIVITIIFLIWIVITSLAIITQIKQPSFISAEVYQNRWIVFAEIFLTVIAPAVGFMRYKAYPPEFPFGEAHLLTLIFLVMVSVNSYWASRLYKEYQAPLIAALIPLGILQGIIINIILLIHFGSYSILGAVMPIFGFELIAPVVNILLFMRELYFNHLYFRQTIEPEQFSKQKLIIKFLVKLDLGRKSSIYFILLMPFFVLQQAILTLLGQRPDAAVRVFVESCGFTFSDPAYCPPPSGHYLCTIAVHGNPQLVKPLRKGVRWGYGIMVNRQLLVANAFEQWLEEFSPSGHRVLRRFYDSLKIPVDKWSEKAWVANVLYILMKPLEWFFLLWLYMTDIKPENRIALQYLPKKMKSK